MGDFLLDVDVNLQGFALKLFFNMNNMHVCKVSSLKDVGQLALNKQQTRRPKRKQNMKKASLSNNN